MIFNLWVLRLSLGRQKDVLCQQKRKLEFSSDVAIGEGKCYINYLEHHLYQHINKIKTWPASEIGRFLIAYIYHILGDVLMYLKILLVLIKV